VMKGGFSLVMMEFLNDIWGLMGLVWRSSKEFPFQGTGSKSHRCLPGFNVSRLSCSWWLDFGAISPLRLWVE
jgi:hypothetical protein